MPQTYIPLQPWSCDKCGSQGRVEAPAGLSYESLMLRIHDQHVAAAEACADEHGFYAIRLGETIRTDQAPLFAN